ncbi:MAG: MFS transporter [Streptosporangiaceae bacterium]
MPAQGDQPDRIPMADPQPPEQPGQAVRAGIGALLRATPAFRLLWTARLLSFFGDSMGLIALLLYTARHFGSGLAVALLMIASDFVPSLLSPVAGVISDRLDKRAVMTSCELAQGVIVAVIAVTLPSLPVLLALVAAQSCVATVFQPASRSAVPSLVPGADLERANAAIGFGTNGVESAGPLAAATLLAWLSIRDLLLIDAATFAISAALLMTLPALALPYGKRQAGPVAFSSHVRDFGSQARDGLAYLWHDKVIRIVTLAFCAVVLFNAVDDVALVFLAKRTLHASNSAASLLYAGAGLGLLAGFVLIARASPRLAMPLLILVGYAVSSLGNLLTGVSFAIVAALGFQVVRGLGVAAMDVGHNTLIQRLVPADMLGRVFGNVYGAVGVAAGLSYLFGGLLLDAAGARVTLIVAGTGGLAVAGLAATILPRAIRSG